MKQPPAPKRNESVRTALGAVAVAYVPEVKSDGGRVLTDCLGHASFEQRKIQVKTGMHATSEAHTLRHEWAHFVCFDAGLSNILTNKQVEMICDAFARALYDVSLP